MISSRSQAASGRATSSCLESCCGVRSVRSWSSAQLSACAALPRGEAKTLATPGRLARALPRPGALAPGAQASPRARLCSGGAIHRCLPWRGRPPAPHAATARLPPRSTLLINPSGRARPLQGPQRAERRHFPAPAVLHTHAPHPDPGWGFSGRQARGGLGAGPPALLGPEVP